MSGATAWKPAAASAASWWRQEYQDSGKPWQRMTSGPAPCSATCMRIPFVSTVRCLISIMAGPLLPASLGHHGQHALHEIGIEIDAARLQQMLDLRREPVNGRVAGGQLAEGHPEADGLARGWPGVRARARVH